MTYQTNCVGCCTPRLLISMVDNATEISYSELLENVSQEELDKVFPVYVGIEDLLTLESDHGVSFYKSEYNGDPCVYVQHSAIEYIFSN